MSKKKSSKAQSSSSSKTANAGTATGKGRPTPKRNASRNTQQTAKAKSSTLQWFLIAAVLISIVVAIIVLGTIFGEPYDPLEYLEVDAQRRQEELLRGG